MNDFLNAFILLANFIIIPAMSYGSQLALGALGVTLIFSIMRLSDLAVSNTMAFGTMITIFTTWGLWEMGINFGPLPTALLALPAGIIASIGVVLLSEKWVYRYYRRQKSTPIIFLMASLGLLYVMGGIVRLIIGTDDRRFTDGERFIITARAFKEMTGLDEGLTLRTTQSLTIVISVILVVFLYWFLQKTRIGKAMRAFSDNENLSLLCGINPERIVAVTWILSAVLVCIAGVLYGLDKSFKPFTYYQLMLPIFAAAIVGGYGNPLGAIAGGYIIAFAELAITYVWKKFLLYLLPTSLAPEGLVQFLSTDYKIAVSFLILVLVLLVRPTGFLRGKVV